MDTIYTPIEYYEGLYIKRDDLYKPFNNNVNGTKCREGLAIIEHNLEYCKKYGVITGCNLTSPQGPIISAICEHYSIPCTVCYGGTTSTNVFTHKMPRLAKQFGANINTSIPSGRQNVLQAYIDKRCLITKEFKIKYGIDLLSDELLLKYVGVQVKNIPKEVENLYLVCGSSISTLGILLGLDYYNLDHITNITLFGNAPNRMEKIKKHFGNLFNHNKFVNRINYIDMYAQEHFSYDRREPFNWNGIELHPNYEAKAFKELLKMGYPKEKSLFWIIGSEITEV